MGYETKEGALQRATEVKAMMNTPDGWRIKLCKGLDWNWVLIGGAMTVTENFYRDGGSSFRAYLSDNLRNIGGSASHWSEQSEEIHSDPNIAVENALECANDYIRSAQAAIDSVPE